MKNCSFAYLLSFVCLLAFGNANQKAETIAFSSHSVVAARHHLIQLVEEIKPGPEIPTELKAASLSLLGKTGSAQFHFAVAERKAHEHEILAELNKKLPALSGEKHFESSESATAEAPLFSTHPTMAFIAAPGSAAGGHHVYPGGLVQHTYTNVLSVLAFAETYEKAYQIKLPQKEKDLAVLAALWHDAAKTWVLEWKEDGSLTQKEGKIAGTSAHHIWGLAELVKRDFPTDFIVAVAGAHDAVIESQASESKVMGYLLAAAIIAGKPSSQVGLSATEPLRLVALPNLSHYLNNLGDADWSLSVPAQKKAFELVSDFVSKIPAKEQNWKRLALLSKHGEIPIYSVWKSDGPNAVRALLQK